ncbi:hypothetical protein [Metabacillus fastidiosus]|uniref:hypothetical protein n=1 Tax=Metabacillus fastidiosus TaxID=1458 RepID=UPI003D2BB4DF
MVTLLYIGIFIAVMLLMAFIDTFIYGDSIVQHFFYFLHYDPGTRKWFMYIPIIMALINCIIIDRKRKKEK